MWARLIKWFVGRTDRTWYCWACGRAMPGWRNKCDAWIPQHGVCNATQPFPPMDYYDRPIQI